MSIKESSNALKNIWNVIKVPLLSVGVLWIIHLTTIVFNINRVTMGVYPRRLFGLKGVLTSPLFHSDWGHLFNNSIPLLVSGAIIYYFYRKVAVPVLAIIYFSTGLAVWAFAHQGFHVGASGVLYGLISFIFWSGLFRKNIEAIIMALIVVILYSGMIAGLFPDDPHISWESHLFGAIMGLATSILFSNVGIQESQKIPEEEKTYFFPRDTFEKTLEQRRREQQIFEQERSNDSWQNPT